MPTKPLVADLPQYSLGTRHALHVYRYGTAGARPKVYIHAGLHADELAAHLVAHHLVMLLEEAEAQSAVTGDVTIIPVANPIGLNQMVLSDHLGRYDLSSGGNYNRGFPDVSDQVTAAVENRLSDDADANHAVIAEAIHSQLEAIEPKSEAQALQLALIGHAHDCDVVLDLHTDSEAELHLYLDPDNWPGATDLAAELDAAVVMLARGSGGRPFEETVAAPWFAVRTRFGADVVTLPLTTVIELRGYTDAFDELASRDATALFRFLQRRGAIAGDPGPQPAFTGIAAPFEATDLVTSPVAGIVAFKQELGATVAEGDLIAEIVDVSSNDPTHCRTPVYAKTSGRLFTRCLTKRTRPGGLIAKIQGTEPIPSRTGYLLSD